MLLRCRRLTSFLLRTVERWRTILTFSLHTAAAVVLGSLCLLNAALMLMLTLFLQVTGADWLWPDVAVKSFKFRLVVVYAPNTTVERISFFRRLAPFLDDSKRLVVMGDWNAILDTNIDKVRQGASRLGRCESSFVGLMACHDLVDRFRLDHPGREMWTWIDSSPSAKAGSYLDRVLVRRADSDFVSCPTFHLIAWTDHELVRVSLQLANRPSLAGYWKFNTSLRDFRNRLESLIKRLLVERLPGIGGIRDFTTKYGRQLNRDRTKEAKSIEGRLSRVVAVGELPNQRRAS